LLRVDERVQIQVEFACTSLTEETCLVAEISGRELPARDVTSCLRIVPAGDVEITVSDEQDPVVVGARVGYAVRVTNHALQPASDLTLQFDAVGLQPVGVSVNGVDRLLSSTFDQSTGVFRVPVTAPLGSEESHEIFLELLATHSGVGELRATVSHQDMDAAATATEPTVVNAPLGSIAFDNP
jgi:hypothetical protein